MTHIPYVFLSFLSFACVWVGLRDDRLGPVIAGASIGIASAFVRQTGVVNLVAPLFALLLLRGRISSRWKAGAAVEGVALLMTTGLFFGTDLLRGAESTLYEHYNTGIVSARGWREAIAMIVAYTGFTAQNAGLLFLPLTLPLIALLPKVPRRMAVVIAGATAAALAFAAVYIVSGSPMPYEPGGGPYHVDGGNIFANLGFGPFTLRDTWVLGYSYPFHAGLSVRALITVVASVLGALCVCFVAMASVLRLHANRRGSSVAMQLAIFHIVAGTAVLFLSGIYLDRYSLDAAWTLSVVLPLILERSREWVPKFALVLCAIMGILCIGAMQEYLSWNRARWTGFEDLRARGVSLRRMDGGYEINQYLLGIPAGSDSLGLPGSSVVSDEYILAFNRVAGYRQLAAYSFHGFFGLRRGVVRVLEKTPRTRAKGD